LHPGAAYRGTDVGVQHPLELLPVPSLKEDFSLLQQDARLAKTGRRSRTGRDRVGHGHPSSLPAIRQKGEPEWRSTKSFGRLMFFFCLL
jgi:hypothetical protein